MMMMMMMMMIIIIIIIIIYFINPSYGMTYLVTAIRLKPSGSSTVHIYTQTIHRTTQRTGIPRKEHT
jgi:Na+/H+-translocating membrane pyrophosphatase